MPYFRIGIKTLASDLALQGSLPSLQFGMVAIMSALVLMLQPFERGQSLTVNLIDLSTWVVVCSMVEGQIWVYLHGLWSVTWLKARSGRLRCVRCLKVWSVA